MLTMKKLNWFQMNNLPIRYKLIIHFLLISILPSIGLGVLIDWTASHIIERQTNENTLQLIGKVNKTLESYIGNMQNMTYFISFNSDIMRFMEGDGEREQAEQDDRYGIRKFLQGITTLYPEVAGILITNSRGEYISNEMYARSDKSLTEEAWYREAVDHKGIFTIVGHPVGRNVANHVNYKDTEVVSVVRAILDPDTQEVKGVVLVDLKLRVIAEAAKDVRLGKSGYLMVLDAHGNGIYSPSQPLIGEIPAEWLGESGSGNFSKQIDGKRLQIIYRKSTFTDWTTVGVFSAEDSIMEVREIRFYVISFVFIVCLLGIAASSYLSYSMSRPIGQLMSFMQKAESGDLTIRHWGDRTDEVGMLGRSFNAMLVKIKQLLSLTELQERQKREAELRSLQAHIKPHFLYNTLDTIHWMARKKGADDVAQMVESLSKLFRIGLSRGSDVIPLADEIEHIRSYLQIQQTRYKDKLNFTLNVAPGVQRVSVLKLILQPIVENAIYHGIKERRGPGHILIEADEHDGHLIIRIADDGKGMPVGRLFSLRERLNASFAAEDEPGETGQTHGYGMMNIQARLKLTFGEAYGLYIDSETDTGTTVTMIHPIIRERAGHKERTEVNEDGSDLESVDRR